MEPYKIGSRQSNEPAVPISMRCPGCKQNGTFHDLGFDDFGFLSHESDFFRAGVRVCPNPKCHAIIFAFRDATGAVETSYPPELIDFDPEGIPAPVADALSEAIICAANGSFTAAAIMVRKTLEFLCVDRRAEGDTLKDRLEALRNVVVIAPALLDGADELRLLGNDAAHVKAKVYDEIGRDEAEISIDFTKELLKAVYQTENLLTRLRGLKQKRTG